MSETSAALPGEEESHTVVIGGGPAGLTAAWELHRRGRRGIVYERDVVVGGIARTASYRGYRFDIGGHRFFTKVPDVWKAWHDMLGEPFLERPRLSRIYYRGRFFDYPIKPLNALSNLGAFEAVRVVLSWLRAQAFPTRPETTFDTWVSNRFGRRLFEIFFKTYTEKVWGIPCSEIGADWAAQRIKNLNLLTALKHALRPRPAGRNGEVVTTLIDRFHYPRLGPGMVWERCAETLDSAGFPVATGRSVERVHHRNGRVTAVDVVSADGDVESVAAEAVVSSMPLPHLVHALDPPAPAAARQAADRLRYRDFLTVVLIVDQDDVFPDNWIYVHAPEVRLGRIQNFKNWSPEMVPDAGRSSLGLEYFVEEGDDLWTAADEDLIALGAREVASLGLIDPSKVVDGTVVRMPRAYPVYDAGYSETVSEIRRYLASFSNLYPIGRNGQHRYNNQDHSMMTGILAAGRICGEPGDIWSVNVEDTYHESMEDDEGARPAAGDRLVPQRLGLQKRLEALFARYDPLALGGAIGLLGAAGLFLVTAFSFLRSAAPKGPNMSLLGHYFLGYEVTWAGAVTGAFEAGVVGFAFGYGLALAINRVVGWTEAGLRRELELNRTFSKSAGDLDP